jgi:hypothetical protein
VHIVIFLLAKGMSVFPTSCCKASDLALICAVSSLAMASCSSFNLASTLDLTSSGSLSPNSFNCFSVCAQLDRQTEGVNLRSRQPCTSSHMSCNAPQQELLVSHH